MLLEAVAAERLLADLATEVAEVANEVRIAHETHCLLAERR